jgi:hypothetical protein
MWQRNTANMGGTCDGLLLQRAVPAAVLGPVQHGGDVIEVQLLEQDDAHQEDHARRQAQRLWYLLVAPLCAW